MKKFDLTVSIVLFRSNRAVVQRAIDSVYDCPLKFKLYLVDNSPTSDLSDLKRDGRTEYIFNEANLGFGKAHNIAIKKSVEEASYHVVLNPDVYFQVKVLKSLLDYMDANH